MKTTFIPENKRREWLLKCLHKGSDITIPFDVNSTVTGKIDRVWYHHKRDELYLTIQINNRIFGSGIVMQNGDHYKTIRL